MKTINLIIFSTALLLATSCSKEHKVDLPAQVNKVHPKTIQLPNSSNYDINIPDVPVFTGEKTEEAVAETRSSTKVEPGNNVLQDIINDADWNDKIVLKAGVHHVDETLVINRRIRLRGEEGAILSLGGVLGMYVSESSKTSIKYLEITGTTNSVFGIAVESADQFELKRNHLNGFLISVVVEDSWKVYIKDNIIVGTDGDFVTGGFGITIMNGNKAEVFRNEVSFNSAGLWITDKYGKAEKNIVHDNAMGILLCNVPPGSFSDLFITGNGGSETPCYRWKVEDNIAHDNVWGYVVIDGARENRLEDNEGYNNSFVDIELAAPTLELFAEFVPGSFDNKVDANNLTYIDCGEGNKVKNGQLADVDCSI